MLKKRLIDDHSFCPIHHPRSCNTHVDSRGAERTQ
jgi:hypothetical protein